MAHLGWGSRYPLLGWSHMDTIANPSALDTAHRRGARLSQGCRKGPTELNTTVVFYTVIFYGRSKDIGSHRYSVMWWNVTTCSSNAAKWATNSKLLLALLHDFWYHFLFDICCDNHNARVGEWRTCLILWYTLVAPAHDGCEWLCVIIAGWQTRYQF